MKDRFGFDWSGVTGAPYWSKPQLGRRMFFRHAASSVAGYLLLRGGPLERVAKAAVSPKGTARNVVFIMMQGAPSHTDTFDLKAGNPFPKSFNPTAYNGLLFPQGLMPQLAGQIDSVALVRAARAWANVHGLMQQWVQIGRNPAAPTSKISPHIGSVVALELTRKDAVLPAFLALNGTPPAASGFLPVADAPFVVTAGGGLPNTTHPDGRDRFAARNAVLQALEATSLPGDDLGTGPDEMAEWKTRSRSLMYNSDVDRIFSLEADDKVRYGNSGFGNACVTARNLLRADMGTRFIQISFGSWDHHSNLYAQLMPMAAQFDAGLGAAGRFENRWPAGRNPDRGAGRIRAHGGALESQFGPRSLPAAGGAVRRGADSRRARHRHHRSRGGQDHRAGMVARARRARRRHRGDHLLGPGDRLDYAAAGQALRTRLRVRATGEPGSLRTSA
jgi:hypothetical protein